VKLTDFAFLLKNILFFVVLNNIIMSWTDFIYSAADGFQWGFGFFEFVQNYFNDFLLLLGFFGFGYWMNVQRKFNAKSSVPVESSENTGWYKGGEEKQIK
jgi:hypothetical protein